MGSETDNRVYPSRHPLARHKLDLLRRKETEPKKFRELVGELATMLTYEATQDLPLASYALETPLTATSGRQLAQRVGLVPILRAGLGMVDGALQILPQAPVWHLGFYRNEQTLEPVEYYNKMPFAPPVQMCLILDPMLATGGSACAAVHALLHRGIERVKFVGLIASPEGIETLHSEFPTVDIHIAAIDERLTTAADAPIPSGYIWPGLGDAGDRQFGTQ